MHCAGGLYLVSQGELILAKDYMQHEELGRLGASTAKTFGTLGSQVLILPDFSLLDTGAQTLTPKSVSLLLAQVKVKNQDYVDEDGAALAEQKKSKDWTKDGGQYIPYPATWLNGKRWQDELEPAAPEPGAPEIPEGDERRGRYL